MITQISPKLVEDTYYEPWISNDIAATNIFNDSVEYYAFCNTRFGIGIIKHNINDIMKLKLEFYINTII